MRPFPRLAGALLAWAAPLLCFGAELSLVATPDHADGVYREGEKVTWSLRVSAKGSPPPASLAYVVKKGGLTTLSEGSVSLENGVGTVSASLPEAGTLLVSFQSGKEKVTGQAGAVVSPEKIRVGVACPDGFEAFWKTQRDSLKAIPANPVLTEAPSGREGVAYHKVTLDNIKGSRVHGQIARPVSGAKFPAILQVQYAGVYPLQKTWVTDKAAKGWLALNIIAHDLPIDESEAFYKAQADGPLKNYPMIGAESRETSYFLRMYLACQRAADYLASRPDWDGKTFVVMGTSQGGVQSFVTAAFCPKVTAVMVEVPAGCDPGAASAGRAPGWPYWHVYNNPNFMETSRYFDAVHFAARIKCPLLVGVGLVDTTSPAGCVYAAFNAAQGPKEIVPMPSADHKAGHDVFAGRREVWLKALVQGKQPPAP